MPIAMDQNFRLRQAIICFEGPHDVIGGVQRRISAEVNYAKSRPVDLTVIYSGSGDSYSIDNICYIPVPVPQTLYPISTLLFSIRVAKLLNRLKPFDILESHHDAGFAPIVLSLLRKRTYKVWVEFIHGIFLDEYNIIRKGHSFFSSAQFRAVGLLPLSIIERWAAQKADVVIAVGSYAADKISSMYRVPKGKIHIIPNGVDTTVFSPAPTATINGNSIRKFLFVGRLDPRKGILVLIRAFAKAQKEFPGMELEIIGSGMQEAEVVETIRALGISEKVHLRGRRTDQEIIEAYRSAYAVCMPSLQEGQGITALEAQACGTPIIASNSGGLPEAILDGKTGLLVPKGDSDALASVMVELSNKVERRVQMGQNALIWAQNFNWEKQLSVAEELYSKLTSETARTWHI